MRKRQGADAIIEITLEPMEFEKQLLPKLQGMAAKFALRAAARNCRKQFDVEENAFAALAIVYNRYAAGAKKFREIFPGMPLTITKARHSWRCSQAVRVAALGGDIGGGAHLAPDLAARKLGYRPLKPSKAESYCDFYLLEPNSRQPDGISEEDLAVRRTPFANAAKKLGLEWSWISARDSGASHAEAAKACGMVGNRHACIAFSRRLSDEMGRRCIAAGFPSDYDDERGRTYAKILKTRNPPDENDWVRNAFENI